MIQTLEHIGDIGRFLGKEAECFVVYDPNVAWVAEEVMAALPVKGARSLETSEERKTMDSVLAVERWLLEADASRGALLLAVGGGITTDLVGFAASLYKRGIRYANLPTTLLSQVDAAIGGKTGVNLDHYKNMLGAFHMPEYTFLCADVLRTLPPREFRCGLAELLKTFLLADAEAYHSALQGVTPALIARAAAIKAEIVERDPYEHGERAKLNLGHTSAAATVRSTVPSPPPSARPSPTTRSSSTVRPPRPHTVCPTVPASGGQDGTSSVSALSITS